MGLQVHGKPRKLFSTSWQDKELVPLFLLLPAKLLDCRHAVTDAVECRQVTAKGSPDVALSWIFDLQLGMARLFGQLCSAALDSRKGNQPYNS